MFLVSIENRDEIMEYFAGKINGKVMKIYGDPTSQSAANALIPAKPIDSIGSATLLCTISVDGNGTGITMGATATDGIITKTSSEVWKGTIAASGYASFYRIAATSDVGAADSTAERVQGTVGILGTDIIIASAYMTAGEEQRIDSYALGMV